MGDMADMYQQYRSQRGGNFDDEINEQDFINWLCGSGEIEEDPEIPIKKHKPPIVIMD